MKHSPVECEWGLLGDFFKAISPRSVKSYSHLGEIKDISVRGSWQGLSTARLASGFWFPTRIRRGGSTGAAPSLPLPSAVSVSRCFLSGWRGPARAVPGGPGAAPSAQPRRGLDPRGSHAQKAPGSGKQPRLTEPVAGWDAAPHPGCAQNCRLCPAGQSPAPSAPHHGGRMPAQRRDGLCEHPSLAGAAGRLHVPSASECPSIGCSAAAVPASALRNPYPSWAFWGVLPGAAELGPPREARGVRHGPRGTDLLWGGCKSLLGSVRLWGHKAEQLGAKRHGGIAPLPGCAPGMGPAPPGALASASRSGMLSAAVNPLRRNWEDSFMAAGEED